MHYIVTFTPTPVVDGSEAVNWSPYNPSLSTSGGWEFGDSLTVTCNFGNYPGMSIDTYFGLTVAACNANDSAEITKLEGEINRRGYQNKVINISKGSTPGANDFFSNAVASYVALTREGRTRNVVYKWDMDYNPGSNVAGIKDIEILFDFGDPHEEESRT